MWLAAVGLPLLFVVSGVWRSARRWVRRLARLVLAAWAVFATALAAETAFALLVDTTDSFGLSLTCRRWIDRHVAHNGWGCRDAPFHAEPAAGFRRLAVLGDSFAFGHGIPDLNDRIGERLAAHLRATRPGQRWEVVTVAEPGADTKTQLDRLNKFAAKGFRTHEALLVFNPNDVERLHPDTEHIMGGILLDKPEKHWWASALGCADLYLPNFLYYRLRQFGRREAVNYFGWLTEAYRGPAWAEQQARMDALQRWCSDNGVTLKVAVFPLVHNLSNAYPFAEGHRLVADYWRGHKVPVTDLLPAFRERWDRGERFVLHRFDAHPNAAAQRLAADGIAEALYPAPGPGQRVPSGPSRPAVTPPAPPTPAAG